ncbi:MAG: aminoacyl--tRNA ligase-related protein [Patescibacteria group bacterium]
MLQSKLFTKTRKEAPKDEVSKNAQLLIRAGYIDKLLSGVYTYLPLGQMVIENLKKIIREEMSAIGSQEIAMPALQPKENWQKTGRWDSLDVLYKVQESEGKEYALGPTHEEVVVPLVQEFVSSYKDLPFSTYQFQNKFRMELRAKSGLLRGREFLMKDQYSFHASEEDLAQFYDLMKGVYKNIFDRVGIGQMTYLTFASGGTFSKYSHEFQTLTPAGEDIIYICENCQTAINKEVRADLETCPECKGVAFKEEKAVEVGNIFELKTKYSEPFGLSFKDHEGLEKTVQMGCYGIGVGRLMGTIVEVLGDHKGIVWPEAVAPYKVHILPLFGGESDHLVRQEADKLVNELRKKGVSVLLDDRSVRAGEKFADADLIGLPHRIIISEKSLEKGQVEWKRRTEMEAKMVEAAAFVKEV